jgi:C-terminal processing protease CtpA/Prc
VRLTTAKFYSPSGREIGERGVEPHIAVHETAKAAEGRWQQGWVSTDDTALDAAVETARRQLASS